MLRVARLYYIDGLEQGQIAKREQVSRPTVSRLLALAREQGFVSITVNDDLRDGQVLKEALAQTYPTVAFTVVSTAQDDQKTKLVKVSAALAKVLQAIIKSGDIIGLGAGPAVQLAAAQLEHKMVADVEVLPLTGLFDNANLPSYQTENVALFAQAYQTAPRLLPLPVVFNDLTTKEAVEKEGYIRYLKKLGRLANVAVFSVETLATSGFYQSSHYLRDSEKKTVAARSVGEVLAHFIDQEGQVVDESLDLRTSSISFKNLQYKDHAMVLVSDLKAVAALAALLKRHVVTDVFIDQQSAQALLDLVGKD